jgi:hypothetical protein
VESYGKAGEAGDDGGRAGDGALVVAMHDVTINHKRREMALAAAPHKTGQQTELQRYSRITLRVL